MAREKIQWFREHCVVLASTHPAKRMSQPFGGGHLSGHATITLRPLGPPFTRRTASAAPMHVSDHSTTELADAWLASNGGEKELTLSCLHFGKQVWKPPWHDVYTETTQSGLQLLMNLGLYRGKELAEWRVMLRLKTCQVQHQQHTSQYAKISSSANTADNGCALSVRVQSSTPFDW